VRGDKKDPWKALNEREGEGRGGGFATVYSYDFAFLRQTLHVAPAVRLKLVNQKKSRGRKIPKETGNASRQPYRF
jgi:hypothetical protein